MRNYTWLIPIQAVTAAADVYTCGSISGRSLMIPLIVSVIVFWQDLRQKNDKK